MDFNLSLHKVCIIRLVHICFEKSSSTFWQVRCSKHWTRRSCQKYDEDFFKFYGLLRTQTLKLIYRKNLRWISFWSLPIVNFWISRPEFDISRSINNQPGDFKISTCCQCSRHWKTTSMTVLPVTSKKGFIKYSLPHFLVIRIKENSWPQNSIKPRHSKNLKNV